MGWMGQNWLILVGVITVGVFILPAALASLAERW